MSAFNIFAENLHSYQSVHVWFNSAIRKFEFRLIRFTKCCNHPEQERDLSFASFDPVSHSPQAG